MAANIMGWRQVMESHGGEVRDVLQQIEWHFCYECVI